MTFGALGGFLRTPKNPPGYGPEMVPFANKIVVIGYTARPCTARTRPCTYSCSCTRAIYTAVYTSRGVYGTYTAVHTVHGLTRPLHGPYTARSRPRNGRVHVYTDRLLGHYTAVYSPCRRLKTAVCTAFYTARTQRCTRAVCTARTRPGTSSCTWAVYTAAYTRPVVYTARTRPCTRADTASTRSVHGPFTAA